MVFCLRKPYEYVLVDAMHAGSVSSDVRLRCEYHVYIDPSQAILDDFKWFVRFFFDIL